MQMLKRFTNTPRFEIEKTKAEIKTYNEEFKANVSQIKTTKLEEKKMEAKQITKETSLEMLALYKRGEKQKEIAKKFNGLGYVTSRGMPLTQTAISYAIFKQNFKNKKGLKRGPYRKQKRTEAVKPISFIGNIIADRSISNSQKVKILALLVENA